MESGQNDQYQILWDCVPDLLHRPARDHDVASTVPSMPGDDGVPLSPFLFSNTLDSEQWHAGSTLHMSNNESSPASLYQAPDYDTQRLARAPDVAAGSTLDDLGRATVLQVQSSDYTLGNFDPLNAPTRLSHGVPGNPTRSPSQSLSPTILNDFHSIRAEVPSPTGQAAANQALSMAGSRFHATRSSDNASRCRCLVGSLAITQASTARRSKARKDPLHFCDFPGCTSTFTAKHSLQCKPVILLFYISHSHPNTCSQITPACTTERDHTSAIVVKAPSIQTVTSNDTSA
ncbi:hypothetical protein AAF712_015647 [Marasmius tenuissimus]|uniref:Uncharacterized protein n=1 Tax=Marasmius tenuissimus TaxID=585030 RepID=A0ABR2Z7Q0_9AGAR